MKCYYDLHIHSALSPCGDEDMTPNNIVNMSLLKGLDIIALSDHNSIGNLKATMEVGARNGLTVVPAMEVETADPRNREIFSEHVFSDRNIDPYKSCRLRLTLRAEPDGSVDLTVTDPLTGRILRPTDVSQAAHFDPGTSREKH